MTDYYVDSSVLVKRHIYEPGTAWFQSLVRSPYKHLIITSEISLVEIYSALNRRLREKNSYQKNIISL